MYLYVLVTKSNNNKLIKYSKIVISIIIDLYNILVFNILVRIEV